MKRLKRQSLLKKKIEAGKESIAIPTISEQITSRLLNFKKEREAIYKTILEYENFISVKREELEVIKEKEKNVEKAIELLSSVGI